VNHVLLRRSESVVETSATSLAMRLMSEMGMFRQLRQLHRLEAQNTFLFVDHPDRVDGLHWSCQWKSLCVIFHSPFHLSKVNTSEARALAPANLPDQR
jgi:hypothetical protein